MEHRKQNSGRNTENEIHEFDVSAGTGGRAGSILQPLYPEQQDKCKDKRTTIGLTDIRSTLDPTGASPTVTHLTVEEHKHVLQTVVTSPSKPSKQIADIGEVLKKPPTIVIDIGLLNPPASEIKKKTGAWSSDEHERYCAGLKKYRYGSWKLIAEYVGTRTASQTMSHAQSIRKKKKRTEARQMRCESSNSSLSPYTFELIHCYKSESAWTKLSLVNNEATNPAPKSLTLTESPQRVLN